MMLLKATLKYFFILCIVSIIFACSKVTQENYDRVQTSMTMQQVIAILGQPFHSESINIGGISGTSAIWKDKNNEIDIQFLNDRVLVKSFSKLDDIQNSPPNQKL